jgi:hypothetical protein
LTIEIISQIFVSGYNYAQSLPYGPNTTLMELQLRKSKRYVHAQNISVRSNCQMECALQRSSRDFSEINSNGTLVCMAICNQ